VTGEHDADDVPPAAAGEAAVEGVRAAAGLGRAERVRDRADFARLRREGRRGGDERLRVLVAANGLGHARLACAIPRRYGNAVRRNRLRRLYREAFRQAKAELPAGYDVLLSPPRGAGEPPLGALRASLLALVGRVAGRLERRGGP